MVFDVGEMCFFFFFFFLDKTLSAHQVDHGETIWCLVSSPLILLLLLLLLLLNTSSF
jgi:hypothetical protein